MPNARRYFKGAVHFEKKELSPHQLKEGECPPLRLSIPSAIFFSALSLFSGASKLSSQTSRNLKEKAAVEN